MPLEFIYLNSPPVVEVNRDKQKAMGKEEWHKVKLEKSIKNDSIEVRKNKTKKTNNKTNKQKRTKSKSNFKLTNS